MASGEARPVAIEGAPWEAGAREGPRIPRPPALVWVPAALVGAALALPPIYLALTALGAGGEVWELLYRGRTLEILLRTGFLVAAVTGATVAISLPLAWLTVRTDLPWRGLWSVLSALPLVIPSYVGGYIVVAALGPRGTLQQSLAPWGVERLPEIYGFPGAMLTITLLSYPYVLLNLRAALGRLDPALEESARSLGLSPWATFWRVTLPHLRPALASGALLVALYTLSDFGAVSLLRYETFTWAIYLRFEAAFDRTGAASLSLVLVALALGILAFETWGRGRGRYYRTTGLRRPASVARLGRWRGLALALTGAIVLMALVLPLAVLGFWLIRGIAAGESLPRLWEATWSSASVSALAAVVTVAAALPVAVLSVRYPGPLTGLLERTAYVGFALPGIVIALALVFFGVNYATPLYQTTALLVFAYLILFLPTSLGAIRTSLLQVNPRVEEAARSLGWGPLGVVANVTLPLVRPGLLSGAAMVFLVTMKELPATLLLGPIGFKTLATSLWSAAASAFFAQAAAPALLLIALSSLPMAFFILREQE